MVDVFALSSHGTDFEPGAARGCAAAGSLIQTSSRGDGRTRTRTRRCTPAAARAAALALASGCAGAVGGGARALVAAWRLKSSFKIRSRRKRHENSPSRNSVPWPDKRR
jgi:hypothetical protein